MAENNLSNNASGGQENGESEEKGKSDGEQRGQSEEKLGTKSNGQSRSGDQSKDKKLKKRQSEADRLQLASELQSNFLRNGKNRPQSNVKPKDDEWIRNYKKQFESNTVYQSNQWHPVDHHQLAYQPNQWQPMRVYPQLNPMSYGYQQIQPPENGHLMYHPRYPPNATGSLPQINQQSAPSSGDERKTVIDPRKVSNQGRAPVTDNEKESSEEESETESNRDRSFSLGDRGLIGRDRYRSSFMKDITSRLAVFDGDHYARWEREATRILELTGFDRYVATDHAQATGPARREDQMVAAYLEQHISTEIKNELTITSGSAYDVWGALTYWHDDRDRSELDRTYSAIRSLKLSGDAINEYKKNFMDILKSLAKFGRSLPPDFLIHSFLEGLGDRGAHYRREYKRKQNLDPKTVCLEICRSFEVPERRRVDHISRPGKKGGGGEGKKRESKFKVSKLPFFQARARSGQKDRHAGNEEAEKKIFLGKPATKQSGVCWKCGEADHIFKDCPKIKGAIRVLISLVSQAHKSMKWIFDTGAAVAVTHSKSYFNEGTFVEKEMLFGSIDTGGTLESLGYGEVTLTLKCGVQITIPHVFYCPRASINVLTNIDLDPRVRFMIDSERGYMWANDQDENDYCDFCKVIDDQNVIQLKESKVNAVTRSKANQAQSDEPQPKRLKSTVTYGQRDSRLTEQADPKQQEDLRRNLDRLKKKKNGENPKVAEATECRDDEESLSSPTYLYEDDGGDLRELLGPRADFEPEGDDPKVAEDAELDGDEWYPKYRQKLYDINNQFQAQIGRQKFSNAYEMHDVNGHPGRNATGELCRIHGLSMKNFDCEICNQFNLTLKHSTKASQKWTEGPNDMVHIDLCDPYPSVDAYDGARYFMLILDDYTGMISVYTIRDKSADTVLGVFKSYRAYAERWQDGRPIKMVKTDFGREFENEKFIEEIETLGMNHESGAAYIHYQNGKAERANRTIQNRCQKMMKAADIDERYWPEGVKAAAYLYDRTPRVNSIAPHIAWNRRYDARKLYRFGSTVFYRDPAPSRKGHVSQKEAIFMGYDRRTNGYRLLDRDTNKMTTQQFIAYKQKHIRAIQMLSPISKSPIKLPPKRSVNPVLLLKQVKIKENIIIPRTEQEAMRSKHSEQWREKMRHETDKMYEEGVFENVEFTGQKLIDTKWTFDYKVNEKRFSARLVARGDRQLPNQYEHTFAPTLPVHVLRLLLCIAINFRLLIWNVDVERAFLNARLNEAIFIRPPALLQLPPGIVIRLRRALYGLKQAGHEWHKEITAYLKEIGFRPMPREPCVFVHESIPHLYLGLYVDDLILVCESIEIKNYVIGKLLKKYRLHDRGELTELLGIQFERFEDRIEYDLRKSIEKLCAQFRVDTDPRVTSPLIAGDIVSPAQNGLPADRNLYVSGLGSILYFARVGRAEITHPCVVLSQFRETPMKVHERRLRRVMVYLLNTAHFRMTIRASDLRLKVYSDASFASNFDYRSFFGTIVLFGDTVIDWKSKKMSTTAQSTDESEIIGAYESLRTLIYTSKLICEIIHGRLRGFNWEDTAPCKVCSQFIPILLIDNKSTIAFCQNGFGKRTRQLNVQFIALNERLLEGAYEVQYVGTKENLADVFTKNLPARVIERFQEETFYKV